jgi:hypothetical protein
MQMSRGGVAARMAASSGASSAETAFSTPTSVPSARSRPSLRNAATIRHSGRPSTYLSTSRRARNPAVNRPFRIGFGGGGATSTPRTGQRQLRR